MFPFDTMADLAALARRKAAAPLTPAKPQAPCDHGLFSDNAAQLDLVDQARAATRQSTDETGKGTP